MPRMSVALVNRTMADDAKLLAIGGWAHQAALGEMLRPGRPAQHPADRADGGTRAAGQAHGQRG